MSQFELETLDGFPGLRHQVEAPCHASSQSLVEHPAEHKRTVFVNVIISSGKLMLEFQKTRISES
jgi:hypothetical protein